MEKFDVVIIGSGPGGYVAAIRAGQLGLKTVIIEKDKELGGTCLNIGCIPSKALLTSSDHFSFAKTEAAKPGSVPIELPFAKFDGQRIVSSTEALCFTEAPKKFLVIGAGAIGLELGSVWNRLGSEVTMLEFLPRIAVGFDLELSNLLQRALTAQGIKFHLETKVTGVKIENGRAI